MSPNRHRAAGSVNFARDIQAGVFRWVAAGPRLLKPKLSHNRHH